MTHVAGSDRLGCSVKVHELALAAVLLRSRISGIEGLRELIEILLVARSGRLGSLLRRSGCNSAADILQNKQGQFFTKSSTRQEMHDCVARKWKKRVNAGMGALSF